MDTLFKGETVLAEMRRHFKNDCVTVNEIRELVTRSGSYLREVLERSVTAGIIEKGKKCVQYATCYNIDPKDDRPICPFEPEKPYEESICFTLEKSIEDSVRAQQRDLFEKPSSRYPPDEGYFDWYQCKTSLAGELERDDKSFITEAIVFHHSPEFSRLDNVLVTHDQMKLIFLISTLGELGHEAFIGILTRIQAYLVSKHLDANIETIMAGEERR